MVALFKESERKVSAQDQIQGEYLELLNLKRTVAERVILTCQNLSVEVDKTVFEMLVLASLRDLTHHDLSVDSEEFLSLLEKKVSLAGKI